MATNLTNIPVDEIRALVDERARYEGWIGALESRRGQTPPHVYDRVRGDYDARLGKVMDRLGGFVGALRDGESSLAGREDELERTIGDRRDELSEIELRTAVGEYAADEGERLRAEKEGEVHELETTRTGVQSDLATLRDLLGRSLPPGEVRQAATRQPATPTASQGAAPSEPAAPPAAPARESAESFGGALGAVGEPWPEPASAEGQASVTAAHEIPTGTAVASSAADRGEYEEWNEGAATAVGATAAAGRAPGGAAPPTTFPAAGMPDQEKTLRCPDCGAMNYPTEWYCEKCGGELAAL